MGADMAPADWLELLIKIGGPAVAVAVVFVKLHVKSEVQEMRNTLLMDVNSCAEKLHEKINSRAKDEDVQRAITRLQDAFDEMNSVFIDVLRDIRKDKQ